MNVPHQRRPGERSEPFTTAEEQRRTGAWWTRTLAGPYFPEVRLKPQ